MAFGRRLPAGCDVRRERHSLVFWVLATAVALFALLLAGCGGGGGGNRNGNGGGGQNINNPTITGRVIDLYGNSAPIAGATITVKDGSGKTLGTTVTDSTGVFSVQIPVTTGSSFVSIAEPAGVSLYNTGFVNGQSFNIRTGVEVPALVSKQNFPIGDIGVYNQAGGPPPPPFT